MSENQGELKGRSIWIDAFSFHYEQKTTSDIRVVATEVLDEAKKDIYSSKDAFEVIRKVKFWFGEGESFKITWNDDK